MSAIDLWLCSSLPKPVYGELPPVDPRLKQAWSEWLCIQHGGHSWVLPERDEPMELICSRCMTIKDLRDKWQRFKETHQIKEEPTFIEMLELKKHALWWEAYKRFRWK